MLFTGKHLMSQQVEGEAQRRRQRRQRAQVVGVLSGAYRGLHRKLRSLHSAFVVALHHSGAWQ